MPFRIVPSHVSERSDTRTPTRLALELALKKAHAVARSHPDALVLGADTLVVVKGEILGKPRSRDDAERYLKLLNGRTHRVITGVALVSGRRHWREAVTSRVKAKKLSDAELARFVGRHMDKAGAYAVQDQDDPFIEKVLGPFDNVIGLPLAAVRRLIKKACRARSKK